MNTQKIVEKKKDMLGVYYKTTLPSGEVFIDRFFKEIGLSVRVKN
jgi:hypothetical protein